MLYHYLSKVNKSGLNLGMKNEQIKKFIYLTSLSVIKLLTEAPMIVEFITHLTIKHAVLLRFLFVVAVYLFIINFHCDKHINKYPTGYLPINIHNIAMPRVRSTHFSLVKTF